MSLNRFSTASSCALSTNRFAPLMGPPWRFLRRAGIIAAVLWIALASQAHARPISVQFSGQLGLGALAGTPVWGSFSWNSTTAGVISAPIIALNLNIGNRRFNLSQGVYPAFVQSPYFHPVLGVGNAWGPRFSLRPEFMFGGLAHLSLFSGGNVFITYSYLPSVPIQYLTQAQVSLVPISSIPGPDTLSLSLAALASGLLARRHLRNRM